MDIARIVTFSPGGRPILQKDLETGVFYMKARDSFSLTPGDKHQIVVSQNRRYGGGKIVGESHDNWSIGATWLISGASQDNTLTNLNTFLAQLETLPIGDRFIQWQPDGASYPVFFELRGTAKWNPQYKWVEFAGAQCIQVDVSFPIAPLAYGYPMDIGDPFDVDSKGDYTFDAGAAGDVTVDTTNQVLTAVANLATEKRMVHTARGYTYGDVESTVKGAAGATLTSYKLGRGIKWIDANNFIDVYVDDNGTNSRLRIDVVQAGVRTNRATINLLARIVAGAPLWVRARSEGNVIYAEHFLDYPAKFGTVNLTSYTLSTAEQAVFGDGLQGKTFLSWIPQHAAATVDDYSDAPFTYQGFTNEYGDWRLGGTIPGNAPALVAVSLTPLNVTYMAMCFGWMPGLPAHSLVWNGDFESDTDGWSVAAVTNINGAATSITRQTTGAIKYGSAAGEITCPATAGTGANFRIYKRFRKGITYTVEAWVYSAAGTTSVSLVLGNAAANDKATSVGAALSATYQKISVTWTPTADRDDVHLGAIINAATATTWRVDGVRVYEGTTAPTLKSQSEGRGAQAPLGILQAEACDPGDLSNLAITASASSRGGFDLRTTTVSVVNGNMLATWFVDPNLLTPDDFTGKEVQVEVWGRMNLPSVATAATAILSVLPEEGSDVWGNERFTAEFGRSGRRLAVINAGKNQVYRLGTMTFTVDRDRPRRVKLKLFVSVVAASGTFILDELTLVASRRRALSPTGKDPGSGVNGTTYPTFIPFGSNGFLTKTINPDLSGLLAAFERDPVVSPGLGGSLLEMPPGAVHFIQRPWTYVPDNPATSGDEFAGTTGPVRTHLSITPRWNLARDA
jgi:hypothetical protein